MIARKQLTPKEKALVFAKKGTRCFYCHKRTTKKGRSVDHLTPVYRGGTNDIGNLVPCCRYCNLARGPMDYYEFKEWREKKETLSWREFQDWKGERRKQWDADKLISSNRDSSV